MKLLILVLLLSVFSSLALTKVVQSFRKSCPEFFIQSPIKQNDRIVPTNVTGRKYKMRCQRWNNFVSSGCSEFFIKSPPKKHAITPTVLKGNKDQYKQICQSLNSNDMFATLYDTERRIPVYSAYRFSGKGKTVRCKDWKNEPELEGIKNSADMRELLSDEEMNNYLHQAVDRDYIEIRNNTTPKTKYERGHVFPHQYAANQAQADSTFTFTNVAPQTEYSNRQWEKQVEKPIKNIITTNCEQNPTYIVTGVVPGDKWITIKRNKNNELETIPKGVNIPSYYWTTFCCVDGDRKISNAYLALQNAPEDGTYEISNMSVNRLNLHLTRLYNQEFRVFGTLCLT